MSSDLFDYEKTIEERIELINKHPDPFDIVKRISGMYEFSGTRIVQEYLVYIVKTSSISSIIKADAVKSLFVFSEFEETIRPDDNSHMKIIKSESNDDIKIRNAKRIALAYDTLQHLCANFDTDIATPYKLDMIFMLMANEVYFAVAEKVFHTILADCVIDIDFRYKSILAVENKTIPQKEQYMISFLFHIIQNFGNPTRYRILASQNLLQNYIIDVNHRINVEKQLLDFARDDGLDYNIRADSCDTIINMGISEDIKTEANTILMALGSMFGVVKTVYDNAQNVHNKRLEESSLPIIRFLLQQDMNNSYTYQAVTAEIDRILTNQKEKDLRKIQLSLNRIAIDRSLYHNTSLTTILTKLWCYIDTHENDETKQELLKRLWEELEEMCGTCSSGFIMRLLNTLSGFEEGLSLQISYEEQITANFIGRLNAYAKRITDTDSPFFHERYQDVLKLCGCALPEEEEEKEDTVVTFQENVLSEMTNNTSDWSHRLNFSLFFRTYLSKLREELYEEFKLFLTETEFDMAIRRAISSYEGVEFLG